MIRQPVVSFLVFFPPFLLVAWAASTEAFPQIGVPLIYPPQKSIILDYGKPQKVPPIFGNPHASVSASEVTIAGSGLGYAISTCFPPKHGPFITAAWSGPNPQGGSLRAVRDAGGATTVSPDLPCVVSNLPVCLGGWRAGFLSHVAHCWPTSSAAHAFTSMILWQQYCHGTYTVHGVW